ncbi:elongation of very long chain fatty acids protein 6 [Gracilinanus agilis]|uniref:elongation of very long chain fatty acids protein 6 n=1 Tax=Gracilinanus agilis TaxID=191870 RepID=UPI001CFE0BA5|nr:elongation of very long chain fatty acids protein 6 [Gracilinanus agilis]
MAAAEGLASSLSVSESLSPLGLVCVCAPDRPLHCAVSRSDDCLTEPLCLLHSQPSVFSDPQRDPVLQNAQQPPHNLSPVCSLGWPQGSASSLPAATETERAASSQHGGDTIFIILRKQKLIFLHWYHHITVLLYSWYSYKDMVAGGGWFMTMNYGVHAVMYSYYALRAAGFRVSRKFAMFITLSQITQMLMGCVVNYLVFSWMQQDQCHSHVQNIIWSSLMYLSYFVLFCHFFFEAYIGKMRKTRKAE